MKKILSLIIVIITANSIKAQNLDTVNVSVTLRSQDWAWAVGKYGSGSDSLSRARIRAIRTAVIAANPQSWTTNVTVNNVNGNVVMWIYNQFVHADFGEMMAMGNNNTERTTIYTNIRAINNSALQYWIGVSDASLVTSFTNFRNEGKTILIDN